MTIPRRGSRRVTVDGVVYRWYVRRTPSYSQANSWSPLTVAVEPEAGGRTLVLVFDGPRPDNWSHEAGRVAKPSEVAEAIAAAKTAGWDPSDSGGPIYFELATEDLRGSPRP